MTLREIIGMAIQYLRNDIKKISEGSAMKTEADFWTREEYTRYANDALREYRWTTGREVTPIVLSPKKINYFTFYVEPNVEQIKEIEWSGYGSIVEHTLHHWEEYDGKLPTLLDVSRSVVKLKIETSDMMSSRYGDRWRFHYGRPHTAVIENLPEIGELKRKGETNPIEIPKGATVFRLYPKPVTADITKRLIEKIYEGVGGG